MPACSCRERCLDGLMSTMMMQEMKFPNIELGPTKICHEAMVSSPARNTKNNGFTSLPNSNPKAAPHPKSVSSYCGHFNQVIRLSKGLETLSSSWQRTLPEFLQSQILLQSHCACFASDAWLFHLRSWIQCSSELEANPATTHHGIQLDEVLFKSRPRDQSNVTPNTKLLTRNMS